MGPVNTLGGNGLTLESAHCTCNASQVSKTLMPMKSTLATTSPAAEPLQPEAPRSSFHLNYSVSSATQVSALSSNRTF